MKDMFELDTCKKANFEIVWPYLIFTANEMVFYWSFRYRDKCFKLW